jgi:osmotically-inducible protein OsmY
MEYLHGGWAMKVHESIEPLAVSALQQSPISALHSLEVTEEGEVLILSGKVGSYYYKQLAQETVISIAGNREVVNNIRVAKVTTIS